ncbi:hypothetical protein AURDEDRAFT_172642 [Auricularia subglabra TFB-10046 SS5]|nr:hypothetical protein AURDEDRAFT_172642 [Auricularia subglabra TFB-10046 SS5]
MPEIDLESSNQLVRNDIIGRNRHLELIFGLSDSVNPFPEDLNELPVSDVQEPSRKDLQVPRKLAYVSVSLSRMRKFLTQQHLEDDIVCYDLRRYPPSSPLSFGVIDAQSPLVRSTTVRCTIGSLSVFLTDHAQRPHTSLPPHRCPHCDHLSTPVDTLRLITDIRRLPSPTPPTPAAAGRRPPPIAEPYTLDPRSAPRLAPRYPPYTHIGTDTSLRFGIAHLADPMCSSTLFSSLLTLGVVAPFTGSIVRDWSV